ncbi:MAG: hypothetical protein KKG76_09020 [Euryarchaeota archaeon]|nr:hypothetical protein [Euryarchaeota archaeon]MBU4138422.1 hypothetical protein [Euryarchaeota archaeon]
MALIIAVIGFLTILGSFSFNEYSDPEALALAFVSTLSQHVYEIAVLAIIGFLILIFIASFFTSGAIGMAREANETGKSRLSTMMEAGKKNVVNLFLAETMVQLLFFAGIVFLVPGIKSMDFSQPSENASAGLLLLIGLLLLMIYLLILSVVLAAFRYALVIESLGPVEGIIAGIDFFKKNMFDVVLLILVTFAVAFVFAIIDMIMNFIPVITDIWSIISLIISLCILSPVMALWWVRLYMTRTGKQVFVDDLLAHPNDLTHV